MTRDVVPGGQGVPGNPASVARTLLAYALKLEIEAQEPRERDAVGVTAGRRIPSDQWGDRIRFRLGRRPGRRIKPGVRVRLELEGLPPRPARILQWDGREVLLSTELPFGTPIPDGRLIEDSRWIMQSLRWKLLSSLRGRHDQLGLALLGMDMPQHRSTPQHVQVPRDLNGEQQEAVRRGLDPGLCLIQGPPGTGKSRTIGAMVDAAVRSGRSVLCVAPSNVATDLVLDSVCTRFEVGRPRLEEGRVIRLGGVASESLRERWQSVVDPWIIAGRRVSEPADMASVREEVRRVVSSAAVLVTTVARTHLVDLHRRFDLVVVDEAVMTSLPSLYHVGTMVVAGGGLVLIGDPFQLPVVARSSHPFVHTLHARDPFRILASDRGVRADHGSRIVRLRTQYRMDSQIAGLANAMVYGDLATHPTVSQRLPLANPWREKHLVLVDSSGLPGVRGRAGRYDNAVHAELIARMLRCPDVLGHRQGGDIAVLCRYRDQVEAIRAKAPHRPDLLVDTVHAMQGAEAHTVILDLSACQEHSFPGDYLQDAGPDEVGARLMTVALTRARRRLVVVADLPFLLAHPDIPPQALSRRLLEYLQAHAARWKASLG